jgi:hypothetical protein
VGDIEPYLRMADETGMRIRSVIDTHGHPAGAGGRGGAARLE